MNELPVKKVCTQCREPFFAMPSRAAKIPGAGTLCRRCRMAALDGSPAPDAVTRSNHTQAGDLQTGYPPAQGNRLYPCRICGTYTVNRFYCPEHHQQITMENGPYAEDFGFGSDEGVASGAVSMDRMESASTDA